MKITAGSFICELTHGGKLVDYIPLLRNLIRVAPEAVLVLKPSVVPVLLKRNGNVDKKAVVFPPFSLVLSQFRESDVYEQLVDIALGRALRCFEVADDAWVEGKQLILASEGSVKCLGRGPLVKLANELGLICSDKSSNMVIDELDDVDDYERLLLVRRHVMNATGIKSISMAINEVEGTLKYYWSSHPLLYGLHDILTSEKVKIRVVPVKIFKKLNLLGRPLIFINDLPLVMEVTYNNSIVFLGFSNDLIEIALRALLYVL